MKKEKMTFKDLSFPAKLEYIWDYYKFRIIVGLFCVFVAAVLIFQFAGRVEPDANLMYAGRYNISSQAVNNMQVSLAEKVGMTDANGDGRKSIDYVQFLLFDGTEGSSGYINGVSMQENLEGYNTEILAGDSMILLLDEYYYNSLVEQSIIAPFVDYLDAVPEKAIDAYGIRLSDLDIYKLDGFKEFAPDTIVCMRVKKTYGNFGKGEDDELLEKNRKVFRDMLSYTYTDNEEN
ncbi:MAG: hypothetical protein PUB08_03725 [Firmicutes bacterium]|nr:hypothetical protein [Bacillota bacterium]